jgi:hypothetical protein
MLQLHLDPTIPEDVIAAIRKCIHRGNRVGVTPSIKITTDNFEDRAESVYKQIVSHNAYQCYVDADYPIGDELNVKAEMFLEAAQRVEHALEIMGGPTGTARPMKDISPRGENAIKMSYVILNEMVTQMNLNGWEYDEDKMWFNE